MNAGTPESNYGYWYPGQTNDRAAGSAFMKEAWGTTWLGKQQPRGAWFYGAEIDLGYGFAKNEPIHISRDLKNITFRIENRTRDQHPTTLTLQGLPPGEYTLSKGEKAESFSAQTKPVSLKLSIPAQKFQRIHIEPLNLSRSTSIEAQKLNYQ